MKFGYFQNYEIIVTDTSNYIDSAILKNAALCPTYDTVLKWETDYHNISTILSKTSKNTEARCRNLDG